MSVHDEAFEAAWASIVTAPSLQDSVSIANALRNVLAEVYPHFRKAIIIELIGYLRMPSTDTFGLHCAEVADHLETHFQEDITDASRQGRS